MPLRFFIFFRQDGKNGQKTGKNSLLFPEKGNQKKASVRKYSFHTNVSGAVRRAFATLSGTVTVKFSRIYASVSCVITPTSKRQKTMTLTPLSCFLKESAKVLKDNDVVEHIFYHEWIGGGNGTHETHYYITRGRVGARKREKDAEERNR